MTIADWASLLVKNHSIKGGISLCKRFVLYLGSYPCCGVDEFGDGRQVNVSPLTKSCFIVLAELDVLGASHRRIYDAWLKLAPAAILRQKQSVYQTAHIPFPFADYQFCQ
jgi:hypothetical protein